VNLSPRFRIALLFPVLFLLVAPAPGPAADRAEFAIKFAALAPDGSTWMKAMRALDRTLREKSGGRLGFRFYPGGIAGDELDVLRKIRIGQIHATAFSGVGLTQILPEVRVLDLPFLFRDLDEVDRVHDTLRDHFARGFRDKGFELLDWAEVGDVHLYSKQSIDRLADLARRKVWTWSGDPVSMETFTAMGASPIPLAATDVTTSLSTGMIDTVYGPPLAALALQWHAYTSHMTSYPITHATGAILISRRFHGRLPEELADLLKIELEEATEELTYALRVQSNQALEVLEKKSGLRPTPAPTEEEKQAFDAVHREVADRLTGRLYPQETLDRVYRILGRTP
jgi:TRAP-type transport system periplasmic protein